MKNPMSIAYILHKPLEGAGGGTLGRKTNSDANTVNQGHNGTLPYLGD